jgi:uncharacterized C2H2 Zn-finger protein
MSAETSGSINCPLCSMEFDSQNELERHSRQQHAISEIRESRSPSKGGLPNVEERVQSRAEEKGKEAATANRGRTDVNVCKDCGQAFGSLNDLTTHYKKAHPESM